MAGSLRPKKIFFVGLHVKNFLSKMEEQISHVLYTSDECKTCHALRGRGVPSGVRVENVFDITPRPAWLDGTPTLVDVSVGVLYKGSDALIVLEHMRQTQIQQVQQSQQVQQVQQSQQEGPRVPSRSLHPARPAPRPQPEPAAPPPKVEGFAPANAAAPAASWRSRYNTQITDEVVEEEKPAKIGEASIAEMMTRRAMQLPPQNKAL
jgi:hypothetical protein